MYLFGHVGFTTAAVRRDRGVDLRAALLMALLPDLIDKPVRLLWPALVSYNTRSFAHSLLGAAAALVVLLALRVGRPWLLWACYLGHLLLDRMWLNDSPAILLWPLLGPLRRPTTDYTVDTALTVYNILSEIAGLALLIHIARRHGLFRRARLTALLRTGRLPDPI